MVNKPSRKSLIIAALAAKKLAVANEWYGSLYKVNQPEEKYSVHQYRLQEQDSCPKSKNLTSFFSME
jgi:hypothetical protein